MPYWDPFDEIDRAFERMFRRRYRPLLAGRTTTEVARPLTDVIDGEDVIKVRLELPGVDKGDIEINATEDMLSVTAEKKREGEKEDEGYYLQERSYSSFRRVMRLPAEVDPDKTKAEYKDGVLEIQLSKKTKEKKEHKVKIE
jgi:HSP20 family protein